MRNLKNIVSKLTRRSEAQPASERARIEPKDVIARLSVEELAQTADDYFSAITDVTPLMAKPFSNLLETPQILESVGLLLSGLHLGKTMKILELGAGTCWLSRYLTQLQCRTISCDVSRSALEIGKRLFEEHPIAGDPIAEPEFLHFDGHKIDLPDESVDRIVCHDAFHHIPNQEEVLAELARVLRTGGIAGFAEPGLHHSQTPLSQYEMANHNVLENDVVPAEIFERANRHGFDDMRLKLLSDMEVSLEQYQALIARERDRGLVEMVQDNIGAVMRNRAVFFLQKGRLIPDSRSHLGLAHAIGVGKSNFQARAGEVLQLPVRIENTGSARWLVENIQDIGVVKIGVHLYDGDDRLLNLDFSRHLLERAIEPGETVEQVLAIRLAEPGTFRLTIDLVSEGICWFENIGSRPQSIRVKVRR